EGKRTRVLAVTTRERVAALPEVPTAIELGLVDRDYIGWYGYLAPRDLPPPILAKLNAVINEVIADPFVTDRVTKLGAVPRQCTPTDLRSIMAAERDMLGQI